MTNEVQNEARYQAYWQAIQRDVCGVCLDQADDGACGLKGRMCALQAHLPRLVEVLAAVDSPRMDEYEAAVRAEVCSGCSQGNADGSCALREAAACALYAYLPLVLDAVESANERLRA